MTIERPEPAYSDTEVGMLRSFIDHYRATIRLQASGLTDEQLDQPLPPSDLTLGGMLKHLAFVEDYWFSYNLAAHEPAPPWDAAPWDDDPDWDWHSAAGTPHAELDALLADAIARADRCLDEALAADPELDRPVARPRPPEKGQTATVRWVLVHMVEEYARHAGHADLIRQSIDGATDV
ncbi:DinB family protein [Nocardioides sp.]|uniref:DinB family protein n=1 Tax=Nocardioides sp. TaxID=35761 RepID=UPI0035AEB08D